MSGLCPVYVRSMSGLNWTLQRVPGVRSRPVVSGVSDMCPICQLLISLLINEGNFIVFLESAPTSWGGLRGWGSVEADVGGLYPNWGVLT